MSEEWEVEDEGVFITYCDSCGQLKLCIQTVDPYLDELRGGDLPLEDYCGPCYGGRKGDI